MLKERVSDDIYVFTSERYAQVTAGAILYPDGAVLVDTLAFPAETKQIRDFLENRLGAKVRYVINTHYHSDHTNGNYLLTNAHFIAHQLCREKLDTVGRTGLARAKQQTPELANVEIVLPSILLSEGSIQLNLGKKTVQIFSTPGVSPDSVSVMLKEDRILFAGDMMMPLPYIADGDIDDLERSLQSIPSLGLENVVQGHGEVILRGEIDDAVRANLRYLENLRKKVEAAVKKKRPRDAMREIDIESCGKNRIALNGLAAQLHQANCFALYDKLTRKA